MKIIIITLYLQFKVEKRKVICSYILRMEEKEDNFARLEFVNACSSWLFIKQCLHSERCDTLDRCIKSFDNEGSDTSLS